MKSIKLVFGILFLLFCSNLRAQDSQQVTLYVDPSKIDSLKTLLDDHRADDIEKVRLLNEYARLSFYNRELIHGFTATLEAIDLSEKIGYREGEIEYHETLAAFLGQGDMVSYHHQKARMLFTQLNKSDSFVEVQVPEGYPDPLTQGYSAKLIETLEYFKDIEQKEILATIYNHLAYYYFDNNYPVELKTTFKELIAMKNWEIFIQSFSIILMVLFWL